MTAIHDEVPRGERQEMIDEIEQLRAVLRSLASYVGNGGYNAEQVDPKAFEAKIRDGINNTLTQMMTMEHTIAKQREALELCRVALDYDRSLSSRE